MSNKRKGKNTRKIILEWHWRIGLTAAIFIAVMAITGILLNHAQHLNLDHIKIDHPLLTKAYGMEMPDDFIKGAVQQSEHFWVIATADQIYISTTENDFYKDTGPLPGTIKHIGLYEGDLVLNTSKGVFRQQNAGYIPFNDSANIQWSVPENITNNMKKNIGWYYRDGGISLEKLILDIHAGHILGPYLGPLLMDLIALALLFLAITGLYNWSKRK